MKSIKPGRGPSAMGAMGSVIAVIFGIFWTIGAASMGAPVFFPLFGILFILIGIIQAIYHFKNATGENRYSSFDIVESSEEPDPLNQRFQRESHPCDAPKHMEDSNSPGYCPYCGTPTDSGFVFCAKCGKQLP